MATSEDWLAAAGPRPVSTDPEDFAVSDDVLNDPGLSLMAKGLYALVLTGQGQPVNPYEDPIEDVEAIRAAVDELIGAGLIVRLPRP